MCPPICRGADSAPMEWARRAHREESVSKQTGVGNGKRLQAHANELTWGSTAYIHVNTDENRGQDVGPVMITDTVPIVWPRACLSDAMFDIVISWS